MIDIAFNEGGDAFVAVRDLNAIYKFTGGDLTAAPALTIDLGVWPLSLVFDADGNLIVSTNGCQIVKVDPMTGATEVIAGVKDAKIFDDGIPGSPLTAKFTANIADVAIAPNGDLYVADSHRIRRIRKGSGGYADALVETVAGSIQQKNRAQIANGVGTAASFNLIGGLLMSEDGKRLYISDQAAGMIRELWIGDGVIPVSTEKKLRAGTYNIRFYNDADEGNRHWDVRKAAVLQLLKDYAFDVIGVDSLLQIFSCSAYCSLFLLSSLVLEVLHLSLSLKQHSLCLVSGLDSFLLLTVFLCILLSFLDLGIDLLLGELC